MTTEPSARVDAHGLHVGQGGMTDGRMPRSGPLAPWRLPVAVAVGAVGGGGRLAAAFRDDRLLDIALARMFVFATLAWVAVGVVDRILAVAQRSGPHR